MAKEKKLIAFGDVYFRTLQANNTPSSAVARPQDWREIVEICFENHEADIGRFLRRHLTGTNIATVLAELGAKERSDLAFFRGSGEKQPTPCERAEAFMIEGDKFFADALARAALTDEESALTEALTWTVALVVNPQMPDAIADQNFLATIEASNPNLTGWPVWLSSRGFTNEQSRPRVRENGWEALIVSLEGWSHHLDFQRLEPAGRFYLRRVLQDDTVPSKVTPGTALDPVLVILRVAEAMAVGLAFARALGWSPEIARLTFAFRWSELSGRRLEPWSNPFAPVGGGRAHDDQISTCVEIPMDTPYSALPPFVELAIRHATT